MDANWKHAGTVLVDTATLVIHDPCLPPDPEEAWAQADKPQTDALLGSLFLSVGTNQGDGAYDVFTLEGADGRTKAVVIRLDYSLTSESGEELGVSPGTAGLFAELDELE